MLEELEIGGFREIYRCEDKMSNYTMSIAKAANLNG